MPRQPYLPTFESFASYSVGPGALEQRPKLAALVGQCVSMWADVELQIALCLGALLGVQSNAAVAVFLSLRNARAQRDALLAAADTTLIGSDREIFEAVLNIYSSVGKQRHDLAHGIFGYAEALPDAILWSELSRHAHFLIEVYNKETRPGELGPDPHSRLKRDLFVYREKDLKEVYQLIVDAQVVAFHLHCYLRKDEARPEERFRRLRELPLVVGELARMRNKRAS